MKRGAKNQITKDDPSEGEIEGFPPEGFKKADQSILASRPMRGLPKRALATTLFSGSADESSTSKFTGFAGFGEKITTTSTTPIPTSIPSSQSPLSPFPQSTTVPDNAKTSLDDDVASASPRDGADVPKVDDVDAFNYYKSLRGLNVSFLSAISKATEEDPFKDVSELLQSYKNLRLKIQKDFDERPRNSSKTSYNKSSAPSVSMPAPPAKFSGFGVNTSSTVGTTTTHETKGGFTPKLTASAVLSSGLPFRSNTTEPSSTGLPQRNPFAITTSPADTSDNQPSAFGKFATSSVLNFSEKAASSSSSAPSPFSGFASNASTSASVANHISFGTTAPTSLAMNRTGSSLLLPSSPPRTLGGIGGFGKPPSGNLDNPVGFKFGSPAKTFAMPSVSGIDKESSQGEHISDKPLQDDQIKSESTLNGNSPHDQEGEGEEDETTVHAVKVNVFRLNKANEHEAARWSELGCGFLRLKKHKGSDDRRLLLRNSNTGKIILNFKLLAMFRVTQKTKTLTFIGHDDSGLQTYSIRLRSEEEATTLKEVLEKEVTSLPSPA